MCVCERANRDMEPYSTCKLSSVSARLRLTYHKQDRGWADLHRPVTAWVQKYMSISTHEITLSRNLLSKVNPPQQSGQCWDEAYTAGRGESCPREAIPASRRQEADWAWRRILWMVFLLIVHYLLKVFLLHEKKNNAELMRHIVKHTLLKW